MITTVLKIQLPIVTTDPEPKALIYNEDKSIETWVKVEAVVKLFKEDEFKIFMYGEFHNGIIQLTGQRAPWQEW